jgi:hypothetical protein
VGAKRADNRPTPTPPSRALSLQVVDINTSKTASGAEYPAIPAAGGSGRKTGVPCLEVEPGVTITEGPAVLQTIAAKGK